jgi:flagellar biosynthesis protein FlhA
MTNEQTSVSTTSLVKHPDIMMSVGVVGILMVMLIPLPRFVLDLLLAFNITLSIIVLLVGMQVRRPLEFSVFPSILLMVTLLRLALNIASTRLILLHGNEGAAAAGEVIRAFGTFVVGGNYTVGLVVFSILVIINFVVITKGAGRVAEVAARFTLDAMPGKQMSIDADLNAGLINDKEARQRRKEIAQEADFYGAMDGSSKFVRGDAVAAVIITLVNILGGLTIGVLQQGMTLAAAAQTYTLLTVGEGLVAQVPALIVSTAAGIVITRAASEVNLGFEISRQVLISPKAIGTASGILITLGLVPGLPHLAFLALGGLTAWMAYQINEQQKTVEAAPAQASTQVKAEEARDTSGSPGSHGSTGRLRPHRARRWRAGRRLAGSYQRASATVRGTDGLCPAADPYPRQLTASAQRICSVAQRRGTRQVRGDAGTCARDRSRYGSAGGHPWVADQRTGVRPAGHVGAGAAT